jgi:hypothetical protein
MSSLGALTPFQIVVAWQYCTIDYDCPRKQLPTIWQNQFNLELKKPLSTLTGQTRLSVPSNCSCQQL